MFGWLKRILKVRRAETIPTVAADETGFTVSRNGHTVAFPWSSVERIAAYKQDLYSYDRIVLLIETRKQTVDTIALSEESPGFTTLFGPMEKELGVDPSWYLQIMTPVFEPTPTVLYIRDSNDESRTKSPGSA